MYYSRLLLKHIARLGLFVALLFFTIALFTFDPCDPSPWCDVASVGQIVVTNGGGRFGAVCAATTFLLFGFCAFLLLPLLFSCFLLFIRRSEDKRDFGRVVGWTFIIAGSSMLLHDARFGTNFPGNAGGLLGSYLFHLAATTMDTFLAFGFAGITLVIGLIIVIRFAWVNSAYPLKILFFPITITLATLAFCQSLCASGYKAIKERATALLTKRKIKNPPPIASPVVDVPTESEIAAFEEDPFWQELCVMEDRSTKSRAGLEDSNLQE